MAEDDGILKNPFKGMPKWGIYATIGGSLGVGGFIIYRHHASTGSWNPFNKGTNNGSSSQTESSTSLNPVTGLPYSDDNALDPITGLGYLAEAQQYGSVAQAEASVSAYGQSTATGSGIPVNPASPGSSGTTSPGTGSTVYTSNAAWAQAATAGLADIGYNEEQVATALGDYLTQTPVTDAQAQLINVAIAEYGKPPVGDLQIIKQPITKAKGPHEPPKTSPAPIDISFSNRNLEVSFPPVGGADKYDFKFSNGHQATVTVTEGVFSDKTVGLKGTVEVRAGNAAGWGPYSKAKPFSFPEEPKKGK